ncbi:MFS transporter [Polymorphospora rubra]|uniref:MFS transporter n=1 Tax=Polymorphospora rubra TaxID=338584 RepID=A0A810MSQ4_9ACTN|nr:MFS transporter [Polymorphospora rubra]BCJ63520.1 MFS transporter [Polymorphospora rubra]
MRRLWELLGGNRDLRLLLTASFVSFTGDWILRTGIAYQIYVLTGSTLASAATVVVSLLPQLILGSVAGVFVDRWDRRRTMIGVNVLLAVGLLPLLAVDDRQHLWIVYLVLTVQSCLAPFFAAAEAAVVPTLVPAELRITANALNGQVRDIARLAGAGLGGVLAGVGGVALLSVTATATFAVAAGVLAVIRRSRSTGGPAAKRRPHLLNEWRQGARIALVSPALRAIMFFTVITGAGEAIMGTLMAPFVRDVLHGNAQTYGVIMSAQAVGGIAGGVLATLFGHRVSPRRLAGYGAVAFGVLDLALFLYPLIMFKVWPAILLMVVIGLPGALTIAGLMTVFQDVTDDGHRGRVFGAMIALEAAAMMVGGALAGTLGGRIGIVPILAMQGVGYVVAGLLVLLMLPRRRPEPVAGSERAYR